MKSLRSGTDVMGVPIDRDTRRARLLAARRKTRRQPQPKGGRYIERTQIYAKVSPGLLRRGSGGAA